MIDLKKYAPLLDMNIKVTGNNGQIFTGEWLDWTSEADNEPDPESITIKTSDGALVEIYVSDIRQVEKA